MKNHQQYAKPTFPKFGRVGFVSVFLLKRSIGLRALLRGASSAVRGQGALLPLLAGEQEDLPVCGLALQKAQGQT